MDIGIYVVVGLFSAVGCLMMWGLLHRGLKEHRWKLGIKEVFRSLLTYVYMFWWISFSVLSTVVLLLILAFFDAHPITGVISSDLISIMCGVAIVGILFICIYKLLKVLPVWPKFSPEEKAILKQENMEFKDKHKRMDKVAQQMGKVMLRLRL